MKDPADLTPEEARDLEARLDAEFPIEGMRLDISTLRFQLANRTKERDEARAQVEALQAGNLALAQRIQLVERLTYASNDGDEWEHNGHPPNGGEAECPGCWAADIRQALRGEA